MIYYIHRVYIQCVHPPGGETGYPVDGITRQTKERGDVHVNYTYETCGIEITVTDSDYRATTSDGQVIVAVSEAELLDRLNGT